MPTPELTPEQLQAAFAAFCWKGWTFEAAMADPLRSRLLKARAADMRTKRLKAQLPPAFAYVRRVDPATGRWTSQRVPVRWPPAGTPTDSPLF